MPLIYTYVSPEGEAGPQQEPDPAHAADFYATLGETITVWQCVEASLFLTFAHLVNAKAPRSPLSAAFHQVPSFRGRLDMTNAAAEKALTDPGLLAEWVEIYRVAGRRANRRNTLAHSVVFFDPRVRAHDRRLYLHPSPFDRLRSSRPRAASDKITIKEMRDMRECFAQLRETLHDFLFKLLELEGPP